MALSLDGSVAPLSAPELSERLARGPVWAWVDGPRTPWVTRGDAVEIVTSSSPGLPVVEEAGLAVVADPGDPRPSLGVIRGLFRDGRSWSLLRAPWSAAIASRSLLAWRMVKRVWRLCGPVARLTEQLRRAPTADEAEATHARFNDRPEILAGYAQATSAGLSEVEEQIADRWMQGGDRILDVGCGTGREALGFARRGMHVLAVDASPRATEEARRSKGEPVAGAGELSFVTSSLRRLQVPEQSFDVVFLASDVYASIPGRANRVTALERARTALRAGGIVVVPADLGRARLAQLVIDAPQALVRACGMKSVEPGDRFILRGPPPTLFYRHGFSRETEVIDELEAAGFDYVARVSSYVIAKRREARAPHATSARSSVVFELASVLAVLPRVERARRSMGPGPLVSLIRRDAANAPRRDPASRARLRVAIAICDRLVPFGGGCYRRSLLEIALDAGAADERLFLGLQGRDGHAWLQSSAPADAFDFTFDV